MLLLCRNMCLWQLQIQACTLRIKFDFCSVSWRGLLSGRDFGVTSLRSMAASLSMTQELAACHESLSCVLLEWSMMSGP
eukprot:5880805-Amphidinium_carterae.1